MRSVIAEFALMLSGSVGLTILAKATVILLLGLFAGALSVRAKASWRHLVFATTFAAVLALPLVAITIPDMPVQVTTAAPAVETVRLSAARVSSPRAAAATASEVTAPSAGPGSTWTLPSIATVLLFGWIAGALFLSLSLLFDLLRVRHLRRHGLPSEQLRGWSNALP
jgi:beta-lactamase regulating signal transducer with metallopeptidase domain